MSIKAKSAPVLVAEIPWNSPMGSPGAILISLALLALPSAGCLPGNARVGAWGDPGKIAAVGGTYVIDSMTGQPPMPVSATAELGLPSLRARTDKSGPPQEPAPPDLTLEEVIHLTLEVNPDLQSALERTRLADETLAGARADFFPMLALNESYYATNNLGLKTFYLEEQGVGNPFINVPATVDNLHTQVHFQQDLYRGGQRLARTRVADAERQASLFGLAAVQNRIVYQVAEAYYRVFQAHELVQLRREAVAQVESHLKVAQSRLLAETAVKSDVLQVEVRLAEVREAALVAVNNRELAWAVLENVTGARLNGRRLPTALPPAPWSRHMAMEEAAVDKTAAEATVDAALAEALQRRPELGEGNSQRQAAEVRVQAVKAEKLPTVGLVADYDVFNGSTGNGRDNFFVGLAVSLNLFNGGRTQAAVGQAEARVREIMARNRRLQLDIELDIRRAHLQLKDARERIQVAATAVTHAGATLRQVESHYKNQTATVTQLIDVQVALSNARVRLTNARAEVEIARSALERAIGRLSNFLAPGEFTKLPSAS